MAPSLVGLAFVVVGYLAELLVLASVAPPVVGSARILLMTVGLVLLGAASACRAGAEVATDRRGRWLRGLRYVSATVLVLIPLHIFMLDHDLLAHPKLGIELRPLDQNGPDSLTIASYIITSILLLAPIVVVGRSHRIPFGASIIFVGVPVGTLWILFGDSGPWWYPLTVFGYGCLAEVIVRYFELHLYYDDETKAWLTLGICAPVGLWAIVLVLNSQLSDDGWQFRNLLTLTVSVAVSGGLTALTARQVHL